MKTIYNIAKAELQNLFFSPIAWLIIIIFSFQLAVVFSDIMAEMVRAVARGEPLMNLSMRIFGGPQGIFEVVQSYLYLYIPLLTMNLMSREFSSGSIKLLYAAPITNSHIILGKFLSMMIYSLVLTAIVLLYVIYGAFTIENFDLPAVMTGILGLYLLMCAYSAIGLFMSSLTSYQVVAAVGTLTMLAVLSYVKSWWQDIEFIRDLTYWLAMTGRSYKFLSGLICSEDVIYFITVISLFLSMSIIRLKTIRQKRSWIVSWGKYAGVWVIIFTIGYLSSRPTLMAYYDATFTKMNTLTKNSQNIISKLDGGLTITTYVNLLDKYFWVGMPIRVNDDLKLFERYIRFKPEIKMKYVYYYDESTDQAFNEHFPNLSLEEKAKKKMDINGYNAKLFLTPKQIKEKIDLSGENNRFVRVLERDNGNKTYLRIFDDNMIFPTEAEISAALKRLVMDLPVVGFLNGHDERNTQNFGERDYSMVTQVKTFRYSLINQGFDFENITLENELPERIKILIIAEMKTPLTPQEKINFDKYVARGGNLMIIGEPKRQEMMNELVEGIGVKFMDGCIVNPTDNTSADLILAHAPKTTLDLSHFFKPLSNNTYCVTMSGTTGLEYTTDKGFDVMPLLTTDSVGVWNEIETTEFIDNKPVLNPSVGEVEKSYPTALALNRPMAGRQQKIIVIGDADCISNGELTGGRININAFNYALIQGSFAWMSDGEVPIDTRTPKIIDNHIKLSDNGAKITKIGFVWVLSGLMLCFSLFVWLRRRGR